VRRSNRVYECAFVFQYDHCAASRRDETRDGWQVFNINVTTITFVGWLGFAAIAPRAY